MTVQALLLELDNDPMQRLRWAVLKRFGVLPSSRAARRLTDAEVLLCAANMVLDGGKASGGAQETELSSGFDEAVFKALAEGRK